MDQLIKTQNVDAQEWLYTAQGDPRGYIQPSMLKELWLHTGTACNLACDFCLEGSSPGDTRLGLITLAAAKPFIDEALTLGVEQFSFTGGEPFVAKQIIDVLAYAAQFKPCLVLTNATEPLLKRLHQLDSLKDTAHPISFRVSLDAPDAQAHDAGRGEHSFAQALEGIRALQLRGFKLSIARQMAAGEDTAAVDARYRRLFAEHDIPADTHIVAFPDFHAPGQDIAVPQVSEDCMTRYQDEHSRAQFMCAFSKMVVMQGGEGRVYSCTLVDDDRAYDEGVSLKVALEHRVMLKHHRCYSCFAYGSSCSES